MNRATETLPKSLKDWTSYPWRDRLRLIAPGLAPALLVLIILVGAAFRLTGLDWDSNKHLHPDERFLTSVANDIRWPDTLDTYFDPQASPLSPYTLPNMGLWVYGTLPLWLVKGAGVLLNQNYYDALAVVGRVMSALFSLATIAVLYQVGRRLYGQAVGLLGAALLALSVLDIQLSHFFTVDTFANLFVVLVMLIALRICERGSWWDYAAIGLALGAGMASKLSVATLGVPIILAAGWDFARRVRARELPPAQMIEQMLVRLMTAAALTILTFRVLQPVAFQGPQFWNFTLYQPWLEDIDEQSRILAGEVDAPPWHQWTNRPALIFPLQNMLLWGMGLPLGLAAWAGWALALYELFWKRRWLHLLPVAYVGVTFVYHGTLWVKFMRYFLPIYPFLALFAAYGLAWAFHRILGYLRARELQNHRTAQPQSYETTEPEGPRAAGLEPRAAELQSHAAQTSAPRAAEPPGHRTEGREPSLRHPAPGQPASRRELILAALPTLVVLGGTLLWALAFTSIYTRPHSRVEASRWMIANIPPGSVLANEHWDDWLPLTLEGADLYGQQIVRGVEMYNYDDDTPDKLDRMVATMTEADYLILSSNRLYDSIPRLPMRYPLTTRYYELLFTERLGFRRVAEFTSYPQLLGLQFPDQSAEEAFSVYDHPRVQVFEKQADFDPEQVRLLLSTGVDWESVARLTPKQATAAPDLLQLSSIDRQRYSSTAARLGAAPWAGAAAAAPLLFWALALFLVGLAALPLTLLALSRLHDGGVGLARTAGLLAVSWLAWLLASWRALPWGWWSILLALLVVAAAAWGLGYRQRAELLRFWRTRRRLILAQEALFWGCFLAMTLVRWLNPDLWHPGLGGEKPMDTAYLNAVVSSPFFPAYDPWYAGGYINYYYFGFVLVAALVHLSGVEVTTAYNLAVPTLFAMTASGASSAAISLAAGLEGRRRSQAANQAQDAPEALAAPPAPRPEANWLARALVGPRGWLATGLLGALFVAALGNLGQVQLVWDGLQRVSEQPAPEAPPTQAIGGAALTQAGLERLRGLFLPVTRAADGLMQIIFNERSLNFRPEWWYWNATRVIPAGQGEAGPINEFPLFTFLFADLHAHMMALPLTVLAIAICVSLVSRKPHNHESTEPKAEGTAHTPGSSEQPNQAGVGPEAERLELPDQGTAERAAESQPTGARPAASRAAQADQDSWRVVLVERLRAIGLDELLLLALAALTLGALWPTNTWDFPTYTLLVGAAFGLRAYARRGRVEPEAIWDAGWRWMLVVVAGFLLFKPFHDFSASAYFGAEQWKGSRTPLWAYLIMHGFFLFVLVSYLAGEIVRGRNLNAPARLLGLALRGRGRASRLRQLTDRLVRFSPLADLALTLTPGILAILVILAIAGHAVEAVALLVAGLALLVLLSPRPDPRRQLAAAMIAGGALLTVVVEVVVLKGDISRMNTVFKFYLQVWVLWAIAAAAAMPALAAWLGAVPARRAQRPAAIARRWWLGFGLLLAGCLLYTATAVPGRVRDRFEGVTAVTLDGTAYMRAAVQSEQEQRFPLEYDREAIAWLNDNVAGTPAIVEANAPIYHWGSRFSIYTGLPAVIGWDWHQKQQRAILSGEYVDRRIEHVRAIYSDPNPDVARQLLRRYNVEYIILGRMEQIFYPGDGLNKFDQFNGQFWDKVYENPEVRIYRVRQN